jgi:hypothetical protein
VRLGDAGVMAAEGRSGTTGPPMDAGATGAPRRCPAEGCPGDAGEPTVAYARIGMHRRDFLRLGGALVAVLAACGPAAAERLTWTLGSPRRRVDLATADALAQVGAHLRQQYVGTPARDLLPDATAQLQLLLGLDPASQPREVQRRLVTTIGDVAHLTGMLLAWDLRDTAAAQPYFDVALRAAHEAESRELAALVLGRRAKLAAGILNDGGDWSRSQHRLAEATRIVEGAQETAAQGASPLTVAWLAGVAAGLHAGAQDEVAFGHSLDRARAALSDTGGASRPWMGVSPFNAARLGTYEADGLVRLGRPQTAVTLLGAALSQLDGGEPMPKHRSGILHSQAEALVEAREIDAAARCGMEALSIAVPMQFALTVHEVGGLHQRLQPWKDTPAVRDLGQQLLSAPL